MIKIIVNGQSVTGEYTKAASDSIDYLRVFFSFSEDWNGLTKTAQFTQNEKTMNVLVENGTCKLPSEITEGTVQISVFGIEPSGTKRITTLPFELIMRKSGFVSDGEEPIPPTPDLYSQLVGRVEEAVGNIPEKLSQFENDIGFITSDDVPKKLSEFENDAVFVKESDMPTRLSQFSNDTGFITSGEVPQKLTQFENDAKFITSDDVPKKLTQLENDAEFITSQDVPKNLSQLENDTGFVTREYVDNSVNSIVSGFGIILSDVIAYQELLIGV